MGSGCTNSSNPYNCTNPVSSNCIIYQGDPIPVFGICRNDTITEVMAVLIDQLQNSLDGTSITLSSVTANCAFISEQLAGKNKTLYNLIQILLDSSCTLKELIDNLTEEVEDSATYDTKCVTPTSASTQGTIQGIINKLCELNTSVSTIIEGTGSNSLITTIETTSANTASSIIQSSYGVTKTGTGTSSQISFSGFVPPLCPIPCIANLSNFDSTGKGIAGGAYQGWYICNGNNSTPDMRGYVFAGATSLPGISSPSLQTAVDPDVYDSTYAASIGDRKGEVKHNLSSAELAPHAHSFSASSHSHTFKGVAISTGDVAPTESLYAITNGSTGATLTSSSATIGDASSVVGSGTAHENRQPTYYGYFIMRKN